MANKNARDFQNGNAASDSAKTVADKKNILPAGTPKQRSPYGEEMDPTVPNRAHTEMKKSTIDKKVP